MRRFTLVVAILGLLVAIPVGPASAGSGTITIGNGGADGEIGGTFSNVNGGPWLSDGGCFGDVGTLFTHDMWIEARTAFEFPVAEQPGTTISSATLTLSHSVGDASETIAIYGYAGDGTISAADMVVTGTPHIFASSAPVVEVHDVTSLLTLDVNTPGWAGFSIRAEPPVFEDPGSAHAFECPQMLHFPILTITYEFEDPDEDLDGVINDEDVCPGSVPDTFPQLKENRYRYDGTGLVSGLSSNPPYTIQQTGGCSAMQIIAAMGLGAGQERHGLSRGSLDAWIAALPQF
jgi:hypothetical protein